MAEQKIVEQKFGGDPQGPQVQILKGQQNKNCRRKIGGDPKCKYKNFSGTKIGGDQFWFHSFCFADLFALALGFPITQCPRVPTNFYSILTFLHCPYQFCSTVFVPQFCSADLIALALGTPTIQFLRVPQQFLFCWFLFFYFVLQFLSCSFCSTDLFALALGVPEGPHQFCSTVFVLLTFLHLPIIQCPRVLTNFCSAVFCSTVFCSAFLFCSFCSTSHPCVTFTLHNI